MAFETIEYETDGPIARLTLAYAEKANALSPTLVREFDQALDLARSDNSVKVVLVRAEGKGFCSGHYLGKELMDEFEAEAEHTGGHSMVQAELFLHPVLRLWEFEKPMVAAVHGYALGAGTYYALLPDITIASEDAYFQMPLVQSLGFPGGETMIEPWLFMNFKRAAEYLYTAKTLPAAEAYEEGLVNRVVPRDQLELAAEEMARSISRAPLSTLVGAKALIKRAWEQMGLRVHWQMSNDMLTLLGGMRDVTEFRERVMAGGRLPREAAAEGGEEQR
jgi:enoyl-CoA hydratase/carnithine racemase